LQISLEAEQPLNADEKLKLLIEKDFACLVGRAAEEDAGAFPHPLAGSAPLLSDERQHQST
jgi:hypothetical protein